MGVLNWRLWRAMREQTGQGRLGEQTPKPLPKNASKQIKAAKDARGKRRGSAEN